MHACDYYRDQLLESLYGLLEPGEAQALRTHVAECKNCQASLLQAQKQQALLSRAARMCPAPAVFSVPAEAEQETEVAVRPGEAPAAAPAAAPAVLPISSAPKRSWRRWSAVAAAAAVLIVVAGGSWWYQVQCDHYQSEGTRAVKQVE